MRTNNSIKNSVISFACNIFIMLIGFVTQAIFIKILGIEYLGINGLFTNILSILGIVELGIGNAIIFNLYKPIAENNIKKIKSLMFFYKKAYIIIAFIVFFIGVLIIPFLGYFIGNTTVDVNLNIVYLLFLFQTIATYLFSYKQSIFNADQKNYIVKICNLLYQISVNVFQLGILYYTKNYYAYLIIKILCILINNFIINFLANKNYNYLLDKNIDKLDKETERNIFKKIKALFFHKIGTFIVNGTDNIIISKFINVLTVGLYSNYYLIINGINSLFIQMMNSISSSVGNLLVYNNCKKNYLVFKKIRFFNFWIATFTSICLLLIIQPFICIWVGNEFLLSNVVLYALVFNFYQKMMRNSYSVFKDGAGIWYEDRFVPLIESLFNIVFSIIFAKMFGLVGVFVGTIISGLALWCYSYPKFVYKKLFKRSYIDYAKETIGYILLFVLIASFTYFISNFINCNSYILQVVVNLVICLFIPNIILFIIFRKTDNYKYFKELIVKILKKCIIRGHI